VYSENSAKYVIDISGAHKVSKTEKI